MGLQWPFVYKILRLGDPKAARYLAQRISLAIQRGNAAPETPYNLVLVLGLGFYNI